MSSTVQHIADIPSHIFGPNSVLSSPEQLQGVLEAAPPVWFTVVALTVLVIYLYWLNYWDARGDKHRKLLGFIGSKREELEDKIKDMFPSFTLYTYTGMAICFVALWLILLVRFGVSSTFNYSLSVAILGSMAAIYIYQLLAVHLIGAVTGCKEFTKKLGNIKVVIYTISTVVSIPMIICYVVSRGGVAQVLSYLVGAHIVLLVGLFIYESFILFLSKKVSVFHTILYLCAVEIFPITLIWGFFIR